MENSLSGYSVPITNSVDIPTEVISEKYDKKGRIIYRKYNTSEEEFYTYHLFGQYTILYETGLKRYWHKERKDKYDRIIYIETSHGDITKYIYYDNGWRYRYVKKGDTIIETIIEHEDLDNNPSVLALRMNNDERVGFNQEVFRYINKPKSMNFLIKKSKTKE